MSIRDGVEIPLIGREREVAQIEQAFAGSNEAGGRGVVLVGAPGVGRTRLGREAVRRLATRATSTWWLTASRSAATVPLGVFAPVFAQASTGPVPDGAPPPTTAEPPPGPMARLLACFPGSTGASKVATSRAVVAVDDAHLLDANSAAALLDLPAHRRVFVIATARTGVPMPDAIDALWRDEIATRIEVPALADDDLAALLTATLGGQIDPISTHEIRLRCQGNPLLLREILLAGRRSGSLRQVSGLWRWSGQGYVTARLAGVVQSRLLGAMPPAVLRLGELLACAGPVPLQLLEALDDADSVSTAEDLGLVVVERAGARTVARLAQLIYADVLHAATPLGRRRQLYRRLALTLAATPMRREDDALRAVEWRDEAGLPCPTDLLVAAAMSAAGRLDQALAERLARRANGAGGGARAELLLAERWRVLQQATNWTVARARTVVECAVDTPRADPTDDAIRAWLLLADGQTASALAVAMRVSGETAPREADVSRAAGGAIDRAASIWASTAGITAAGLLGRDQEALDLLTPALAASRRYRRTNPWGPTHVAAAGCLALLATGQINAAADQATQAYRDASDLNPRLGRATEPIVGACAGIRGMTARAQGDTSTAVAALTEAVVILAGLPLFGLGRLYRYELAAAHALRGELDPARCLLDDADREGGSPARIWAAWIGRAQACVAAAAGDLTMAIDLAIGAGRQARRSGQAAIEAHALFDAARFGAGGDVLGRLRDLAASLQLPVVSAMAAVAGAIRGASHAPAGRALDEAVQVLFEQGHVLYAAEAAAIAHARNSRSGGRRSGTYTRAAALADRCPGARTHLLTAARLESVLTARERQVAILAAAGHSSAAIADKLRLSTRTVDNYLGRVYQKLELAGRTGLASIVAPAGPRRLVEQAELT